MPQPADEAVSAQPVPVQEVGAQLRKAVCADGFVQSGYQNFGFGNSGIVNNQKLMKKYVDNTNMYSNFAQNTKRGSKRRILSNSGTLS